MFIAQDTLQTPTAEILFYDLFVRPSGVWPEVAIKIMSPLHGCGLLIKGSSILATPLWDQYYSEEIDFLFSGK